MTYADHMNQAFDMLEKAMEPKPKSAVDRIRDGECLCLECGRFSIGQPVRDSSGDYTACDYGCRYDNEHRVRAITWDEVHDGLMQHVSTREWEVMEKDWPELVKSAMKVQAMRDEEEREEEFEQGQFGVGA